MWIGIPYLHGSPVREQASTDIAETTAKIKDISGGLPAIHALSRCDKMVATYGIGEPTAVKVVTRANPCPFGEMSLPDSVTLHRKQQNSSRHVMVNILGGALQWRNLSKKI